MRLLISWLAVAAIVLAAADAAAPDATASAAPLTVNKSRSEDALPVPIQNLGLIEVVGSSSPRVGSNAPLLDWPRPVDEVYRHSREAAVTLPAREQSGSLDWSELALDDELVELLAESNRLVLE